MGLTRYADFARGEHICARVVIDLVPTRAFARCEPTPCYLLFPLGRAMTNEILIF
jgi:hypothetical protein